MSRAKFLYPKKETTTEILEGYGQCSLTLGEMSEGAKTPRLAAWRVKRYVARGYDPDRCAHVATVEVDGRKLCTLHAGAAALKILMEGY